MSTTDCNDQSSDFVDKTTTFWRINLETDLILSKQLRIALWRSSQYVDSYRFPIQKVSPEQQNLLHTKGVADVFMQHFGRAVRDEVDSYSSESKRHFHFPVPRERLLSYVHEEFPFLVLD